MATIITQQVGGLRESRRLYLAEPANMSKRRAMVMFGIYPIKKRPVFAVVGILCCVAAVVLVVDLNAGRPTVAPGLTEAPVFRHHRASLAMLASNDRIALVDLRHLREKLWIDLAAGRRFRMPLIIPDDTHSVIKRRQSSQPPAVAFATNAWVETQPLAITGKPDGSSFFVVCALCMYEVAPDGGILRRMTTDDFQLGESRFGSPAVAGGNRLWFTIQSSAEMKYTVVEWCVDRPPATRAIGPEAMSWAVCPAERRLYVTGERRGVYSFDANEFIDKPWSASGPCMDYCPERGLLVSGIFGDRKSGPIINIDVALDREAILPWGGQAKWGCDGFVYFIRGSTQLWRCRGTSGEPEPVFAATRAIKTPSRVFNGVLQLSNDRSLLAFYHWRKSTETPIGHYADVDTHGLFMVDLAASQYIRIEGVPIPAMSGMAWVAQGDPDAQPSVPSECDGL